MNLGNFVLEEKADPKSLSPECSDRNLSGERDPRQAALDRSVYINHHLGHYAPLYHVSAADVNRVMDAAKFFGSCDSARGSIMLGRFFRLVVPHRYTQQSANPVLTK
jgi:hypothetical protein